MIDVLVTAFLCLLLMSMLFESCTLIQACMNWWCLISPCVLGVPLYSRHNNKDFIHSIKPDWWPNLEGQAHIKCREYRKKVLFQRCLYTFLDTWGQQKKAVNTTTTYSVIIIIIKCVCKDFLFILSHVYSHLMSLSPVLHSPFSFFGIHRPLYKHL